MNLILYIVCNYNKSKKHVLKPKYLVLSLTFLACVLL